MRELSTATVWVIIVVVGVGTWLIRLSFLALLGRVREIPLVMSRVLRLVPAAVLSALVVPGLTRAQGAFDLGTARFVAGLVAGGVAWRTRNVAATITVGMSGLWIATALS